jgi:hypothetical protein
MRRWKWIPASVQSWICQPRRHNRERRLRRARRGSSILCFADITTRKRIVRWAMTQAGRGDGRGGGISGQRLVRFSGPFPGLVGSFALRFLGPFPGLIGSFVLRFLGPFPGLVGSFVLRFLGPFPGLVGSFVLRFLGPFPGLSGSCTSGLLGRGKRRRHGHKSLFAF